MRMFCVALLFGLLAGCLQADARKRVPALGGELRLDLAEPIVIARIGDVRLRLRLDCIPPAEAVLHGSRAWVRSSWCK